jgi:acyl carrier protein
VQSSRGGRGGDVGAFHGLEQAEDCRRGGRNPIAGTGAYLQAPARLWPRSPPLNLPASFAIRGVRVLKGPARSGLHAPDRGRRPSSPWPKRAGLMSTTFDKVAEIIAETCDIPRENIKPESHAINDLEIDSLDFLDIAFAIDKAFGIKLPLEQWTQEVNDGKATTDQYFVLKNLSDRIDELIAAKGA